MQACVGFNYIGMNYNQISVKFKQKALIEYKKLWNNQRWNEASLSLSLLASILFSQLFRDTFECQVHAETGRTMRLSLLLLLLTACHFTKDMLAVSWEHKPNLIIIIHSIKYMRYAYCLPLWSWGTHWRVSAGLVKSIFIALVLYM